MTDKTKLYQAIGEAIQALIDATLAEKAGPIDTPVDPPTDTPAPAPADPPVPVDPPVKVDPPEPAPASVKALSQSLVADKQTVMVGDHVTVAGVLRMSDNTSKAVTAYSMGWDKSLLSSKASWSPVFTALAPGVCKITNSNYGTVGETTVTVIANDGTVFPPDPPPVAHPPAPPAGTPSPAPSGSGNVYADALVGLALPLASKWSTTKPAYSAQSTITLDDITVLTVDTTKQVPDYVPYAGIWLYPFLKEDGSRHPDLGLDCYADCLHISNAWVDAGAHYAGHHTITINGAVVEDVDSTYNHGCLTTSCAVGLPQFTPSNAWDKSLVPNYGKIDGGYGSWAAALDKADNSINGRSLTTPADGMGNTGAQYSIGVLHGAMVPYVVDGGAENWRVVDTIEKHANVWPIHLRDRSTGLPAVPFMSNCRDVSLLDAYITPGTPCKFAYGHINPVVLKNKSPHVPDNAHCPGFGIVGYLATGSARYLEEMQFWAAYEVYWNNPSYHGYEQCLFTGQVRGCAWQLRSNAYAAELTPVDHPLHDGWRIVMENNATHFTAKYCGPDAVYGNQFGILGGEASFDGSPAGSCTSLAPWMQDHFVSSVHQTIRLGFTGWDDFKAFLDIYTVARMGAGDSDSLFWTMAPLYEGLPRKIASYASQAAKREEYVADWATFNNQNLKYNYNGAYADQVGKPIDQANVGGGPGQPHPAFANDSFWSNYQQAVASLSADNPAWKLYEEKILPLINYKSAGQFNIVPEAG